MAAMHQDFLSASVGKIFKGVDLWLPFDPALPEARAALERGD
jgi:hypothetical protein